MTSVFEKATGLCAHGDVCSREQAEASFKRRRSPRACIFPPGEFRSYYGEDFGPEMWFVGLYYDDPNPKEFNSDEQISMTDKVKVIGGFTLIVVVVGVLSLMTG